MSLPINILSRSFRLILAAPTQTLKVIAPGMIVSGYATYLLFNSLGGLGNDLLDAPAAINFPLFGGALLLGILGWMTFAILWHRYALLQGDDRDHIMRPTAAIFGQYFKGALVVGVISFLAALPGGFVLGFVLAILAATSASIITLASIALSLAFAMFLSWVLLRVSLILPAAATGQRLRYSESWQATKAVSRDVLWTAVLLGVLNVVVEQFASGLATAMPAYLGLFVILQIMVQSLIYISVLSTLYGYLLQGRSLD
ncbi:hypothetical protein [uncultured Roseobacter sp.]|uniref:hypothetical protein n=1 Tax=uncultured Roseobacter sp. TaxID=114847 RepID=UPI00260FC6F8|nr:hypothetical protein [uncultured Roseobacter sp.]